MEGRHEGMSFERRLHDPPLDACPAPVNQADFPEAGLVRRPDVFLDDRGDVTRLEGVEVQGVFDRQLVRVFHP